MLYIDFHTHNDYFDPEIISVINIFLSDRFEAFTGKNYYSAGLHPWHIKSASENDNTINLLEKTLKLNHVIFVGECGLDKLCDTDFEEQKRVFIKQVQIAEKLRKPAIIHCVKAVDEILEIRKRIQASNPWIMHGYTGNVAQAKQLQKHGFLFSFGKILFNKNSKAIESFKKLPLEFVFLETDEFSGSVKEIYKKASELKKTEIKVLAQTIEKNFKLLIENELA